jgi:hypothetical protein
VEQTEYLSELGLSITDRYDLEYCLRVIRNGQVIFSQAWDNEADCIDNLPEFEDAIYVLRVSRLEYGEHDVIFRGAYRNDSHVTRALYWQVPQIVDQYLNELEYTEYEDYRG